MGKVDFNALKARRERLENPGKQRNFDYDKLSIGKNVRRILWPKGENNTQCFTEGFYHFGLGNGTKKTAMVCRRNTDLHNYCPACELAKQLQDSSDPAEQKLGLSLKAKRRAYFNVIVRDDPSGEEKLKVLPVGTTVLKQIIDIACEDHDYGDITDYNNGRDIIIKRSGQGLNTEYTVIPRPNTSIASIRLSAEELEAQMVDLDAFWKIPSVDDMKKVIYGDFDDSSTKPSGKVENTFEGTGSKYDEYSLAELQSICRGHGIPFHNTSTKLELIQALEVYELQKNSQHTQLSLFDDINNSKQLDPDAQEVKDTITNALNRAK